MIKDIMIDLETLATGPDTVVLSIGAVAFDLDDKILGTTLYTELNIQPQLDDGRKIAASTLRFWVDQNIAIFKEALGSKENRTSPENALTQLANFIRTQIPERKERNIWGNGATFDISILENMYEMYGIECPWGYAAAMDLRTFKRFVGKGKKIYIPVGKHNALADAVGQAEYVLDILKGQNV